MDDAKTTFYIFALLCEPMSFFKFLFSKTFLVQLALAVVAIILLVLLSLFWLDGFTKQDQRIEVPSLKRLSLDEVDRRLDELHLRREILDSASYNPDFPPYSVIDQTPVPGKYVKENRMIYLTLNPSGYREMEIPENLIRKTRRQVEPALLSLGFEIGEVTYEPDVAKDVILELKHQGRVLEPGDKLKQTSVIDLVLGDGTGRYEGQDREEAELIEEETELTQDLEEGWEE